MKAKPNAHSGAPKARQPTSRGQRPGSTPPATKEKAKPALVPKLRFQEFRGAEGWDADALGDVANFVNEKVPLERVALENYVSTENILPNLLIFAVTRKTAAELITARANPADPHFGLLAWKGDKVRKANIIVAKNYLTEDEIDTLNRLVVIFLETAELRAKQKQETRMAFWKGNVDQIITSNGFPLLTHAGSISHEQMEERTGELYLQFDQNRQKREAAEADQQDKADLKALETKIKRRPKK